MRRKSPVIRHAKSVPHNQAAAKSTIPAPPAVATSAKNANAGVISAKKRKPCCRSTFCMTTFRACGSAALFVRVASAARQKLCRTRRDQHSGRSSEALPDLMPFCYGRHAEEVFAFRRAPHHIMKSLPVPRRRAGCRISAGVAQSRRKTSGADKARHARAGHVRQSCFRRHVS